MKRKRQAWKVRSIKRRKYGRKRRYRSRKYRSRALRQITTVLETKKRFWLDNVTDLARSKFIYQPLSALAQGSSDAQFEGNSIFIKAFHLRGQVAPFQVLGTYAGPGTFYIYLIKVRDEVNTGDAWTTTTLTNGWFSGSSNPDTWFVNQSKCKVLYRKRLRLKPDLYNAFSGATINAASADRAPVAAYFNCRVPINKMHYFKETDAGAPDAGLMGKYYNYYWLICDSNPFEYSDVGFRMNACHKLSYKDP